jgi:hypothetical protein
VRRTQNLRQLAVLALAGLAALALALPAAASAPRSTQNEGQWVSFNPDDNTVTVRITKAGRGPDRAKVRPGSEATFNVIPEGSVLTRTTVTINGRVSQLADIPAGKTVLIYWQPDQKNEGELFARKIDVVFSEAELDRRYPDRP